MDFISKYINNENHDFVNVAITKANMNDIDMEQLKSDLTDCPMQVEHTMFESNYINIYFDKDKPNIMKFMAGQEQKPGLIQIQVEFDINFEIVDRLEINQEVLVQGVMMEGEEAVGPADCYGFRIKAFDEGDYPEDIQVHMPQDKYITQVNFPN